MRMSKISQKPVTSARLSCGGVGTAVTGPDCPERGDSNCGVFLVPGLSVSGRGENVAPRLLVFAPGSEMRANLPVPGFRLPLTGCAPGDASAHLSLLRRGLSGRAVGHENLLLQCRHPGGHERLGPGHEPGCAGAVSVVAEEVSPSRGSLGKCFLP